MNATEPIIETQALTKVFGEGAGAVRALQGVNLRLARGEFVAVMGPSGSGKSTLLHLIGGLDSPTSGRVLLGGQDLSSLDDDDLTLLRRRQIGFVFQEFNLVGVLTAGENVALPLEVDGIGDRPARERAVAALERVDLMDRRDHLPGVLSGGERQRVAIARALVAEPLILLADEPTGNLDSASGGRVITTLRRLADENEQTILMVTHNPAHAAAADRIIRLRDGRVTEEHTLKAGRPADEVLADLESTP